MYVIRPLSAVPRRALVMSTVLALFVSSGFIWSGTGRGQTTAKQQSTVKPIVKVTSQPISHPVNLPPSPGAEAVSKNVTFRNELTWTFGGKEQRGWSLYDLLISRTLDTESQFDSGDFASSLSAWQRKRGLSNSGVLDQDSLMAMITEWQGID